MRDDQETGVTGQPRLLLRAEGAVILAAAAIAYGATGSGWGIFAALFLVPDIFMAGYLAGPRIGSWAYNAGHSYLAPGVLLGAGYLAGDALPVRLALIWVAHIGFDRMLGYGLKYPSDFGRTHLGPVGKAKLVGSGALD